MYRLTEEIALIQTLDFFTPIVDDPHDFGRIAAANSLSDVYAMGGQPLTAMNIVCFPIKSMDRSILRSILQGGLEILRLAGAAMVGGHSVDDEELKYGLSVTGIVHPERFLTNAGSRPGDVLVLTKPLGTGILATALKAGQLDAEATARLTALMVTLNRGAAEAAAEVGVNACTDITGFGLLGHCLEMARASSVGMVLSSEKVPILPEARTFASLGLIPGGSYANRNYCAQDLEIDPAVDPILADIMSDPQTSGGLLLSVPRDRASLLTRKLAGKNSPAADIIGEVVEENPGTIRCR